VGSSDTYPNDDSDQVYSEEMISKSIFGRIV